MKKKILDTFIVSTLMLFLCLIVTSCKSENKTNSENKTKKVYHIISPYETYLTDDYDLGDQGTNNTISFKTISGKKNTYFW